MREPLGVLASIHYGKSPAEVLTEEAGVPVVGTGGAYAVSKSALFERGVVVARKGSLGSPHLFETPFWPSDTTYAVIPRDTVDLRWLYYCISAFDLTSLNEATGVPSISRDWLAKVGFENPGQTAQRKIAAILTSLDTAIEKTEALIAKHQQIKAGLMHDLFTRGVLADGTARPKPSVRPELYRETSVGVLPADWEVATLHSLLAPVANNMRSGPFGSALLKDELVEVGIPFLGIDNIHPEEFRTDFKRFVSPRKFQQLSRYGVRPGDVVITIMGTVGRSCVVPESLKLSMSSKHLWTMTFDQTRVLPELVCWQLNHAEWVKSWFRRATQGGIMDAIQSSTLKGLSLPVPPILEQQLIAARYRGIQLNLASLRDRLVKARLQKQALMQVLLTGPHKPTPSALTTETS